jgi:hypothetical protein
MGLNDSFDLILRVGQREIDRVGFCADVLVVSGFDSFSFRTRHISTAQIQDDIVVCRRKKRFVTDVRVLSIVQIKSKEFWRANDLNGKKRSKAKTFEHIFEFSTTTSNLCLTQEAA